VITELEFKSLSEQGYNRIALIDQAFADLDTPLSLYLKSASGARVSDLQTPDILFLQFHPESILSEHGMAMLANFVHLGAAT
jgi:anthranilate/para-aminobenzoate synthase component II